ncbi:hypothetical protein ES708_06198 [subsurface metagenome]
MTRDGRWREAAPFYAPTYSPEWARSVYEASWEFLLPWIIGQELDSAADLLDRLVTFKCVVLNVTPGDEKLCRELLEATVSAPD